MKRKFYSIEHKTFAELGVATYKQLWEKAKSEGYEGISVNVETKFLKKSEDGEKKLFHATFSSSNEDRHGDIVHQVFHLVAFQKNPVYLDSHNYDSIEHIIGRIPNIGVADGVLQGDVEFATMNPKGALAEKMAEGGFLHASSIGFIPMAFNEEGDIIESELLEISAVSVPANADALFEKTFIKTKKADCPDCCGLPENEVAEGHNHVPEEETEPETKPDADDVETTKPDEEPAVKASRKSMAIKVTSSLIQKRQNLLKSIAQNVHELTEQNRQDKKRKIFQAVRTLQEEL
ncbi:MAG TPA: hypothetical protein VGE62_01050 [Candidatus Paceibacterota bacterium]